MPRQAEFRGGSELTTVDAYDAKAGIVLGSDKVQFAQRLEIDPYKEIDCQDALQPPGTKLPPPFQYASGLATSKIRRNATCLDYKARYRDQDTVAVLECRCSTLRYCCKGTSLFRPMPVSIFDTRIKNMFPIGVAVTYQLIDLKEGFNLKNGNIHIYPLEESPAYKLEIR